MVIILAAFVFLCLFKCKINKSGINNNYLGFDNSIAIKGLFAVVVMLHHITNEADCGKFMFLFNFSGFIAVSVFFFYSGYGLMYSYTNKENYLNGFVKKRISKILLPYIIIVLIYSIVKIIIDKMTITQILMTFVNGYPVADYSWFVIAIMILYAFFFIAFKICKNQNSAILLLSAFVIIYSCIASYLNFGSPVIAFLLGIYWKKFDKRILANVSKNYSLYLIALSALFFITFASYHLIADSELYLIINALLFVSVVMVLQMKIKINNVMLRFLGKISFEIYMIHGLYIYLLKKIDIFANNSLLFFARRSCYVNSFGIDT